MRFSKSNRSKMVHCMMKKKKKTKELKGKQLRTARTRKTGERKRNRHH